MWGVLGKLCKKAAWKLITENNGRGQDVDPTPGHWEIWTWIKRMALIRATVAG
jgi:hypothetical protein